jgi:hypothetical protein
MTRAFVPLPLILEFKSSMTILLNDQQETDSELFPKGVLKIAYILLIASGFWLNASCLVIFVTARS